MEQFISVIIPNYNDSAVIGNCLTAVFASKYGKFEVIVVDDCSSDRSVEIINRFPCKLIRLAKNQGVSKARNIGAAHSVGEILFFTDSDCMLLPDTLSTVNAAMTEAGERGVIGGTYTELSYDRKFFSDFQSVIINYSELKNRTDPDHLSGHAMAIYAERFRKSGGFPEDVLPEDVELSHRLKRMGSVLAIHPRILVEHSFEFNLIRSLLNAYRRTSYWIIYSFRNEGLLADSGSASIELKTNGVCYLGSALLVLAALGTRQWSPLVILPFILGLNIYVNRDLAAAFARTGGKPFALKATVYYSMLYPAAIWIGAVAGIIKYFKDRFSGNAK